MLTHWKACNNDQLLFQVALTEDTFLSITSITGSGLIATSVNDQLILSYNNTSCTQVNNIHTQ